MWPWNGGGDHEKLNLCYMICMFKLIRECTKTTTKKKICGKKSVRGEKKNLKITNKGEMRREITIDCYYYYYYYYYFFK